MSKASDARQHELEAAAHQALLDYHTISEARRPRGVGRDAWDRARADAWNHFQVMRVTAIEAGASPAGRWVRP